MTYDEKCYDLAEAWLEDYTDDELFLSPRERAIVSLAIQIQKAIEDWCLDYAKKK